MKTQVIVVAAGLGKRLGKSQPKALVALNKIPLIVYSLKVFEVNPHIKGIIIVSPRGFELHFKRLIKRYHLNKIIAIVPGGRERMDSVRLGLKWVSDDTDIVLVHDAARPFIKQIPINQLITVLKKEKAAILAVKAKATLKQVDLKTGLITKTLPRQEMWEAQTPQGFHRDILIKAHQQYKGQTATDDAMMVELMGIPVKIVEGDYSNIKITTPEDLTIAKLLGQKGREIRNMDFRVGFGYDVHRFIANRKLILGGIQVPHTHGLEGHSDADVVLHAICDALLGALALGDIGEHFPNTDVKYKDISSSVLLAHVNQLIVDKGWLVNNLDVSILAEEPKLKVYKKQMAEHIAGVLNISDTSVNIKAGTNEGLGFIGAKQGLAAYAVVSLLKK